MTKTEVALLTFVLLAVVTVWPSAGNPLDDSDGDKDELFKRQQRGYLVNPEGRRPEAAKRDELELQNPDEWLGSDVDTGKGTNPLKSGNTPNADDKERVYDILRWLAKNSAKANTANGNEEGKTSSELARERGRLEGAAWMYNFINKNLYKSTLDQDLEAAAEDARDKSDMPSWNSRYHSLHKSQHKQGTDEDTLKAALNYLQSKLQKRDHDIPFPLIADHQ